MSHVLYLITFLTLDYPLQNKRQSTALDTDFSLLVKDVGKK